MLWPDAMADDANGTVRWRDLDQLEQRIRADFRTELALMEKRLHAELEVDSQRMCEDITEVKDIATENRRALDQLRGARTAVYAVFGTSAATLFIAIWQLIQ